MISTVSVLSHSSLYYDQTECGTTVVACMYSRRYFDCGLRPIDS